MELEFGEYYTITATHVGCKCWSPPRREWRRHPLPEPVKALYIGKRQVYSGPRVSTWEEDYFDHSRRTAHTMYLFVIDERHNPVYVNENDIIPS